MPNGKKSFFCISIIVLFLNNASFQVSNISYSFLQNKETIVKDYLSIENISYPEYYYHNIIFNQDLAYLYDYFNYRMGIYNLSDIANPNFISEYDLATFQNNTLVESLFTSNLIIDVTDNVFQLCGFKLDNNTLFVNFHLLELTNYTSENVLSELSFETNITSYRSDVFLHYENGLLYIAISDYDVNYVENWSFYNLSILQFNLTDPYSPEFLSYYHVLTDYNKTTNKLTNPYNKVLFENNFLYFYREFHNTSVNTIHTDPEDDHKYSNLRIIRFDGISSYEICSEINFTQGAFPTLNLREGILFHSIRNYGFDVYNLSNPYQPIKLSEYQNGLSITGFQVNNNLLIIYNNHIIELLDISNLKSIQRIDRYNPHKIEFITGKFYDNYFIMTQTSTEANNILFIFEFTNKNKIKLIYPEGVITEFWYTFTISAPIIFSILIFSFLTYLLLKKKKKDLIK